MLTYSITLKRSGARGFLSSQSIGTDALNAMSSIPGVKNPIIIKESDEQVEIKYGWDGSDKFWETDTHLHQFGLERVNVK